MWQFLFDLDGTILDTTNLILQSFVHAFAEGLGQVVTHEELMVHFGRPLEAQFRIMCSDLPGDEINRLISIYREHNEAQHDAWVSLVPGAGEGLRELAHQGYALGIVTSKRLDLTVHGLQLFGLDELFEVIVHADSTTQHKPHPEPVQRALELMKGDPDRAAYIGDSPYDMAAGCGAGLHTVGLVHNTFSADVLRQAGAEVVVSRWSEVVQTLTGWATQMSTDNI